MRDYEDDADQTALHGAAQKTVRADWTRYEQPVLAIAEAIAAVKGKRPTDLRPLGRTVDVDSLTRLVETEGDDEPVTVSFQYEELEVTITSGGELVVTADPN